MPDVDIAALLDARTSAERGVVCELLVYADEGHGLAQC